MMRMLSQRSISWSPSGRRHWPQPIELMWAPGEVDPTELSWLLIVVLPGRTARFAVKRHTEQQWWRQRPDSVPWLALSTAGSLRAALEQGKPLVIKAGRDKRLFGVPAEGGEVPPSDEHGRI